MADGPILQRTIGGHLTQPLALVHSETAAIPHRAIAAFARKPDGQGAVKAV
ncbi:hypothetical protein RLO149_c043330 [Roseobacter litoralis Och 149]|uniref:Uncharacterized protein n=1 Tax=Roseobacter litoralis (strain ATCC 49566 / DSM 6996 / JCM 21268 / NBRC 15278 / OCh 149) TaxID=391595 RepID=F7ZI93_ROSLO|nr:hypothetical protein RLO149_c043330 [Roseobacter litoralis Och 149]